MTKHSEIMAVYLYEKWPRLSYCDHMQRLQWYDELTRHSTLNALKFHKQIMSWTICLLKCTRSKQNTYSLCLNFQDAGLLFRAIVLAERPPTRSWRHLCVLPKWFINKSVSTSLLPHIDQTAVERLKEHSKHLISSYVLVWLPALHFLLLKELKTQTLQKAMLTLIS